MAVAKKKIDVTAANAPLSLETGEQLLRAQQWRQAIDCFKSLAKNNVPCQEQLAMAYRGRAGELATKGMAAEAIVMLDNAARLDNNQPDPVHYLTLLMQANRYGKAMQFLLAHEPLLRQHTVFYEQVTEWLAVLLLVGHVDVAAVLPQQSPWRDQQQAALRALDAWCRGDHDGAVCDLKQLPVRSPFRRFRAFLQALLVTTSDRTRAQQLLAQIPPQSPFYPLATVVQATLLPHDATLVVTMQQLPDAGRQMVGKLLGLDTNQIALFRDLNATDGNPAKVLPLLLKPTRVPWLNEMLRYRAREWVPLVPIGLRLYEQRCGTVSRLEQHRWRALVAEQEGEIERAIDHWQAYIAALQQQGNQNDEEQPLRIAAVLRYCHRLEVKRRGDEDAQIAFFG
ncbi:MAG: hypothetical protein HQL60_08990 [Magnetococcales bacterium]|nr:hypothetical protein [Magnetococcales bacterium]